MKSLRLLSLAAAMVLAVPFGYSDDQLGRKPNNGNGNGSSSQGDRRPDRKPENGPRPRDEGQKPRNDDSRPRPREESPRPRGNDDSRPRPREESPRPRGNDDSRPRPREESPRPRGNDDNLKPRPYQGPPTPPREERPRPRDEGQKPRNDDPPRPRINDGPRPNNNPPSDQGGRPRDDGQRPRGNDDLLKPRPGGGNNGGNDQGNRPDRNPFPRENNPRIYDPPQNRDNGRDQLGRTDVGNRKPGNDTLLGRRGGQNYGGSISNTNRSGQRSQPSRIDRAPVDIFRGGLPGQVLREERVRINRDNCRVGYYHYYNSWCDDNFWFNWYVFDPFRSSNCFVSPWYYYPHLPAYVNRRCGTIITINLSPWYGSYYNWRQPVYYGGYDNYNSYDYSSLDYAVEDIRRAFQDCDRRALSRLIPSRDRVAIFVDGEYTYSMEPRDFEDFMLDAVEGTRTIRYEITRVERRGREAEVQARHEYEDPWGRRAVVYHHFRLEDVRGYFVITRFGTSYYR